MSNHQPSQKRINVTLANCRIYFHVEERIKRVAGNSGGAASEEQTLADHICDIYSAGGSEGREPILDGDQIIVTAATHKHRDAQLSSEDAIAADRVQSYPDVLQVMCRKISIIRSVTCTNRQPPLSLSLAQAKRLETVEHFAPATVEQLLESTALDSMSLRTDQSKVGAFASCHSSTLPNSREPTVTCSSLVYNITVSLTHLISRQRVEPREAAPCRICTSPSTRVAMQTSIVVWGPS